MVFEFSLQIEGKITWLFFEMGLKPPTGSNWNTNVQDVATFKTVQAFLSDKGFLLEISLASATLP